MSHQTSISITDCNGLIATYDQRGGHGTIYTKALAVPGHLGAPWRRLDYVSLPSRSEGSAYAGIEDIQVHTDVLYYIIRGSGTLTLNGREQLVPADSLVVAPRGTHHTISNASLDQALSLLAVELLAPETELLNPPTVFPALHSQLASTSKSFPASKVPLSTIIDLKPLFSSGSWGTLSLIYLPAGGRLYEQTLPDDHNLFVLSGLAVIRASGKAHYSTEDGLNVLVPAGLPWSVKNRSSVDVLAVLSVRVHPQS